MLNRFTLLSIVLFIGASLQAQVRYVDPMFSIEKTADVVYAENFSILTGMPVLQPLLTDVYEPAADDSTNRPAVILMHTGSFLPPYLNGGITGARSDSAVVNIATRLAQRGYVVFAATYRAGWNPFGSQNIRTGTLLNAAYRGGQDAHTAIRWIKKGVAEDDNPYGVDPSKIVVWGLGTGGYNVNTAAYLDRYSELNEDKWFNSETGNIFVDSSLVGGPLGLDERPLNRVNHPGYDSDFALGVTMGGALGDTVWVEGKGSEPAVIGLHVVSDPFAPFANGPVIVPTNRNFVVNVHGSSEIVRQANTTGGNDTLAAANVNENLDPDVYGPLPLAVNLINQAYKGVSFDYLGQSIPLSRDNMYPFRLPGLQAGPWDYWDKATLDATIPVVNMRLGTMYNSDTLHLNSLRTNPDMSPAKANAYIDTTMAIFIPRGCEALGLDCAPSLVPVEELLSKSAIALTISPNPATDHQTISADNSYTIREVTVYDVNGRKVRHEGRIDSSTYRLQRNGLTRGTYILRIRFDEGIAAQKVMFY